MTSSVSRKRASQTAPIARAVELKAPSEAGAGIEPAYRALQALPRRFGLSASRAFPDGTNCSVCFSSSASFWLCTLRSRRLGGFFLLCTRRDDADAERQAVTIDVWFGTNHSLTEASSESPGDRARSHRWYRPHHRRLFGPPYVF